MSKIIFINLRNVREDNDLKQKDLAKLISVSPRTYSHYENYEREMPIATWKLLSKIFNHSIDFLCITAEVDYDVQYHRIIGGHGNMMLGVQPIVAPVHPVMLAGQQLI